MYIIYTKDDHKERKSERNVELMGTKISLSA